jgi:NADH-quinone oxidoreductase subunit H
MSALISILIFPGFLFLSVAGLFAEFVDRKLYARFQKRVGPPWFQPFADFIKLAAKQDIIPEEANPFMFKLMPLVALTSVVSAFIYIPSWRSCSLYCFTGDLIVVLYLLTIPTLTFFIAGWYSTSLYARMGSARTMAQLFSYEVPLFLGVLAPAVLADTWSLSGMAKFYSAHPFYWLVNLPAFLVSLTALLGKLEKVPFDIAEAETEVVAGPFTEYSGRLLAMFRLAIDIEMVVGAALLAAVFIPFGLDFSPVASFFLFLLKILFIIGLISLARSIFARMRIDQMISFCFKLLIPLGLSQLLINLLLKALL